MKKQFDVKGEIKVWGWLNIEVDIPEDCNNKAKFITEELERKLTLKGCSGFNSVKSSSSSIDEIREYPNYSNSYIGSINAKYSIESWQLDKDKNVIYEIFNEDHNSILKTTNKKEILKGFNEFLN